MPRDHDHDQTVTPVARITLFLVVAALLAGVGGGTVALSIPSDATASVRPVIRQPEQSSGAGAPTDTEAASKRILQSVVQVQTGGGSGSGFVMDDDGHVITNHHLIAGSTRVTLVLPDGSTALGRVIGSDDVRIGEQVIAVGSPLGLNGTLTAGMVSALDRSSQWSTQPLLQSDASINPGKVVRPTRGPRRPRGQQLDDDPGPPGGQHRDRVRNSRR